MVRAHQTPFALNLLFCTTSCKHAATGAGRFAQALLALEKKPDIRIVVVSEDIDHQPERWRFRVELPDRPTGYAQKSRYYASMIGQVTAALPVDVVLFNNAWLARAWLQQNPAYPPVLAGVRDDNAVHAFDNALGAIPRMIERKRIEQAACRALEFLFTNSLYLADALTTHYRIDRSRISVLPPAYMDYASLRANPRPLIKGEPVRVLFGKHDYHRGGLHLVLRALEDLRDFRFALTIAGPEEDVVRRKFDKDLQALKHVEVDLRGRVYDHQEMIELMETHHVYCVPSRREAFGVANLEALCCGMRVVFHPTGGIPRELGQFAFPVADWTWQSVREALHRALRTDHTTIETMIGQGRTWAAETYDRDRMLEQLEALVRRVHTLTSKPNARTD
ncbi:MAG: glycosyltransferase family 4 protein [Saprospiraceae bacterium]|nr:glycosyltransferase family 4 protein [Saprospiraceae bacterium]